MDHAEKQIIRRNEKFLRDNVHAERLTPYLIQSSLITVDDAERIGKEVTHSDKVHRLLRIIETLPTGFSGFKDALNESDMGFITEKLESTEVDKQLLQQEKDEYEKQIDTILKRTYCVDDDVNQYVILGNIEEEVRLGFRMQGEVFNVHSDHLRSVIGKCFQKCVPYKRRRSKEWAFKYLRRIRPVEDEHTDREVTKYGDEVNEDTTDDPKCSVDKIQTKCDVKSENKSAHGELKSLSEQQLVHLLKPLLEKENLPDRILDTLLEEEINGSVFKRLKLEYMENTFPYLSKGKRLSLLYLRDEICKEEQEMLPTKTDDTSSNVSLEVNRTDLKDNLVEPRANHGLFRETFRKFDKDVSPTDSYRRNAILITYINRPSNLLDPVHVFSYSGESTNYDWISNEVVEFVAACLNERTNGTIHIGVDPKVNEFQIEGEIKGCMLDVQRCLKSIYEKIEKRFFTEQLPLVLKCMRPPKFIDVSSKEKLPYSLRVVEVDIVPQSLLVAEEVFFVRSSENLKPVLYLFTENGIAPQSVSDERCVKFMSTYKNMITDTRKHHESHPKISNIKPNLRQKILDLLSAGDETISSAVYPLLFLSPLQSSVGSDVHMDSFEFLMDLDPNAIFDFDYSSETKSLYEYFNTDKEKVLKALTTDNFDQNSEENKFKKESFSNLLEDIALSVLKPWIFCNGYEPMNKLPMSIMDWKQNRSKGFKEAIRFYSNEIPEGRAQVLIFLLSKDYDILLEAAEEVILSFKDQWIVFAESEEIANHWNADLIKRHAIDKDTMRTRTVIGMPWEHINQTIKELTGSKRSHRCEIPTSTGAFCHLKDKIKNELVDLEIVSRNECDDPELIRDRFKLAQIRRDVEEKFYRGENVSWWNFAFPDHVLKRDVHAQLKQKVEEALEGKRSDEDNKIGLVNIFHQPGAGATTTAKHIIWEMKSMYRCCIVKQITDQTVDQITTFRNYDETDDPKPPLVLIENADEEKVGEMFAILQNKARIMARRSSDMKVFCVLLLCTRRTNIHSVDDTSVALKHELSLKELAWFRNRNKDLEKQFQNNEGTDPRFLISFNILKENFNTNYIHRTAVELVKGVTNENEKKMLQYLSLLNTFDLDFQSIPISAFDPIMTTVGRGYTLTYGLAASRGKRLNKSWEQTISQPLQILMNRNTRAGFGSQLIALSIVNQLFAAEIFSCFNQEPETLSKIVMEFLECPIVKSSNSSSNEVKKVVRTIMKKREDKEDTGKVKFSPLVMKILEDENEDMAAKVLVKGFELTDDPMICQQIARLYIHCKNWKLAAKYANIATTMKPQNSFLWDTFGQVYKNQLYDKYICFLQEGKSASDLDIEEAIEIAQHGLQKFHKEQEVCEIEHFNKVNDAGYFGEIRMIILLLDLLRFSPIGRSKSQLHLYLTDKNFLPKEMPKLKAEHVDFMKNLEIRSELTLKAIEDKTTQLKDDMIYSIFGHSVPRRNEIATLRENLDNYFGEETDVIPENLSDLDKAEFRRRRVKRLGGRTLANFIHIDDKKNLCKILEMLLDNIKSEACQPFDIVTSFNVVIAMKILKIQQTLLLYPEMVQLSKKCYDRVVSSSEKRTYLEAYMYFVLFNWPTRSRLQSQFLCATEQLNEVLKKWKIAFHANYPRQKEHRPVRKRETTNFFLGLGDDIEAVVHYEELLDPWGKKFVRGDKVWESADFVQKLLRLPGTLINDGTEISCNVETRSGGVLQFLIPTSFPIGVRSLWQKRVYFVLGFSWSGVKAYDVRSEIPQLSVPISSHLQQQGTSRPANKKTADASGTHESFIQKVNEIKTKINRVENEKRGGGVGKERKQFLDRKQAKYEKLLEQLLTERKEFYGT